MAGDRTEGVSGPVLAPLFPLHTVLFPGGVLPLHLFEHRYRLLMHGKLDFVVVLIRSGGEVGRERIEGVHEVGTMATTTSVEAHSDGTFSVHARGLYRVRLPPLDRSGPYLRGSVERLADPETPPRPLLVALLGRYLEAHGVRVPPDVAAELVDPAGIGPARAVWLAGALLQAEPDIRQRLLESGDPALAETLLDAEL